MIKMEISVKINAFGVTFSQNWRWKYNLLTLIVHFLWHKSAKTLVMMDCRRHKIPTKINYNDGLYMTKTPTKINNNDGLSMTKNPTKINYNDGLSMRFIKKTTTVNPSFLLKS